MNGSDPNLFGFGCLLWLAGTGLVLSLMGTDSQTKEKVHSQIEQVLRDRLSQLGIPTWQALQQKSGLTPHSLRRVRRGEIGQLKLNELQQLAAALNWSLEEMLHIFGISSTSATEIEQLRQQCLRLREELQQQASQLRTDERDSTFEQLQTLLTNYPTARIMVQSKSDLPAKNLVALFTPLENLLKSWGYEPIGTPWEQVPYDPQLHQPDADDIAVGELVYIRFVGYRDGDRILSPAKVSRTLPPGIKTEH